MTITNFMDNIPQLSENASGDLSDGSDKSDLSDELRFSIAPEEDQTETAAFKKWFNGSKVVDENGKPLVVYHGTDRYGFTEFREDSHFTADYDYAKRYANKGRKNTKSGVYAVFLSIQNPFDIRKPEDRKIFTEYRQGHTPAETKSGAMDWAEYDFEDFREYLQENYPGKYDGVILDEGGDAVDAHRGIAWVPFSPTQIKSATDNIGTFDPDNPDIRFSLEEYSESEQEDIVAVLQVFVGRNIDMEPEKYREYLRSKGIEIPDEDADVFFRMAVLENDRAARERANRLRDQWIYENFPIFAEVAEFVGGSDFKIKPVKHEGEEFTGSFISPEAWRKNCRSENLLPECRF